MLDTIIQDACLDAELVLIMVAELEMVVVHVNTTALAVQDASKPVIEKMAVSKTRLSPGARDGACQALHTRILAERAP